MNFSNGAGNEDKIIRTPGLNATPDPRGLGYVFFTQMQKHKDNVAQIDGLTGEKDTFGSLWQRCVRTAITLQSKGITSNDVVTLCTFNHLNSCVPFIATLFLGAKVASVDPTLSPNDTVQLLKQVNPKIIFVIPEAVEMIKVVIETIATDTEIVVFGNTTEHTPFDDFLQPNAEEEHFKSYEPKSLKETAVIVFSSGTSGLPKGICITHLAYLGQILIILESGLCPDVIATFASFYWITAILFCGIGIVKGSSRLVLPKFDVTIFWEKIDKYKPTVMFIAPTQALALYNYKRPEGVDSTSLKDVLIGGGPMLKASVLKMKAILPETRVSLVYGQTEVAGFISCFKPNNPIDMEYMDSKPISSGSGLPGFSYKVVDPDTEEILGPFQEGELRIKTDFQLSGYYNLDSSTIWDSDGWIKTGDVGYYDNEFCFYVFDRIKEMLKFQSWHIQPALLENILLTHPAIATAVVIGLPHEIDGEHPMAIVVLKENSGNVIPEEIEKYVEGKVHDRQRLRGGVKIVKHIPLTPSGKVKRREVKNMILQKIA